MYDLEKRIKRALAEKKMSLDELAEKSRVSRTTIYNMFKSLDFTFSNLEKIREVLEVPMIYFFYEENTTIVVTRKLGTGKMETLVLNDQKYVQKEVPSTSEEYKEAIKSKDEQIRTLIEDIGLKNKVIEDYITENRELKKKLNS